MPKKYQTIYWNSSRAKKRCYVHGTFHNGVTYDSVNEARYAENLERLKKDGEIVEFKPHPKYELSVNGISITTIIPDFRVLKPDGSVEIHEVKSRITMTEIWRLKWALLMATAEDHEPDIDFDRGFTVILF